jgi:uncharacterized protein (DUF1778 family)
MCIQAQYMATKRSKGPKKARKELTIMIRVTGEQKRRLAEAATHAGLGLSSWLLTTGLQAIERAEAERARTAKESKT